MSQGQSPHHGSDLAYFLRRLVGRAPLPPWFDLPPANLAQTEVRDLLGEEQYRVLVKDRRISVHGSAGGRYTLWAARALRGADAYYPKVFDDQRRIALCVALDPQRRPHRAWEDEWNGLVRWIRWAEPIFLETANPMAPRRNRRVIHRSLIRTSAEFMSPLPATGSNRSSGR